MSGPANGYSFKDELHRDYQAEQEPPKGTSIDREFERLAKLPTHAYDMVREEHAEELGIRVSTLDKEVAKCRKKLGLDKDKTPPPFTIIKPWDNPVAGDKLLTDIANGLASHVVLPAGAATAISLWILHAHAYDCFDISPILSVTSPTPECGKTTLLTFLGAVVPKAIPASNITSAALFRAVEKWTPTLLVDEADTFLRDSDELRGVLNSGHAKATAQVVRTVGDGHEPTAFKTWSPKAIACIGRLAPTLASRSIHIELRRKGIGELVVKLRPDRTDHLLVLARKAARWAADNAKSLKVTDPDIPATLTGRREDNWRPLLAIADMAGGPWPSRARKAAEAMVADDDNEVAGILLLQDIHTFFDTNKTDRVSSLDLSESLKEMLDRPWPDWKSGKPISETQVARLLKGFKVKSRTIKITKDVTKKGYLKEQFKDAFERYLSLVSPLRDVTPSLVGDINDLQGAAAVTSENEVTAKMFSNPLRNNNSDGVTFPGGGRREINDVDIVLEDEKGNICSFCGQPDFPGSRVIEASMSGQTVFGHEDCLQEAAATPTSTPIECTLRRSQ
jgi:putative DNA primase/helicase